MSVATPAAISDVTLIDVTKVEPVPELHRNFNVRRIEFQYPDGRVIRVGGFGRSKKGSYSPRHRHTFDQVRMVLEGGAKFGPLRCHGGDCVYFPEGVFYGPQEHITDYATILLIQTQGPTWGPFPTYPQMDVAYAAMQDEGVFDRAEGKFRWKDGRVQDGFEAILEHLIGGEAEYPEPRYHSPCVLRSNNFAFRPMPDGRLAAVKPLAGFNGSGPLLELWKLEPGAETPRLQPSRNMAIVLMSGGVSYHGQAATPGTYLFCPPGSTFDGLQTNAGAELLSVEFEPRQ